MPEYLLLGEVVVLKRPAFQQQEKPAALGCRQGLNKSLNQWAAEVLENAVR